MIFLWLAMPFAIFVLWLINAIPCFAKISEMEKEAFSEVLEKRYESGEIKIEEYEEYKKYY